MRRHALLLLHGLGVVRTAVLLVLRPGLRELRVRGLVLPLVRLVLRLRLLHALRSGGRRGHLVFSVFGLMF